MRWVEHCIRQQLAIYLLAIMLCAVGLFSLYTIPIAPFPSVSFQELQITFKYPGASAETVQTQVTDRVQQALRTLPNLKHMRATSQMGKAKIELALNGKSHNVMTDSEIKVMQAISSSHLPTAVKQPEISPEAGSSGLITYIVTEPNASLFQVDNFIQSTLYPKFSTLPGVSILASEQQPSIKIQLNLSKIAQYQLKLDDITQRLNNAFQAAPLGTLYIKQKTYPLQLQGDLNTLEKFRHLIIGYHGTPIQLQDIATVSFGPRNPVPDYFSSFKGQIGDAISLFTHARANPFAIDTATQHILQKLRPSLPADMKIQPVFNMAAIMQNSFYELTITVLIATLLVLLVALMFLGHLRTTLIPVATIPICLLGAITIIHLLGFSLNILTLLAMVIAVGLVVDDAIVVVENITRYLEQGLPKMQAIVQGTNHIATTIIGITSTLLAVYLPIAFCQGDSVIFIRAFATPLAAAVFISGIVALTLTPIMCIHLVSDAPINRYQRWFNTKLAALIGTYQAGLKQLLKHPKKTLFVVIVLVAIGSYLALAIPKTYFPPDPDNSVNIVIKGGPSDTIKSLRQRLSIFKPFYQDAKVDFYSTDIRKDQQSGLLSAQLRINYLPQYLQQDTKFADKIRKFIKQHNLKHTTARAEHFSNWGHYDLIFTLYGDHSTGAVNASAKTLTKKMQKASIFATVSNTIHPPFKQLQFQFNAAKAAKFGIYRSQVSQLLATAYGGYSLNNNFSIDGLSVPVVVQLDDAQRQTPKALQQLQIQSPVTDKFYPITKFANWQLVAKPTVVSTYNTLPSVDIEANLAPGYSLSDAIPYINRLKQQYAPNLNLAYQGAARSYLEGNTTTQLIIIFGLLAIYALLAILFRNLGDPFIILLTVPFTVVGGALSLYLIGGSINIYSIIGLITLIGLVTKHGILIIKFANQHFHQSNSALDAILAATHERFRPIIMTTLAMTLGALPLVFSSKLLYVARENLGIVLIGGLIIGTLFSLVIIPVIYIIRANIFKSSC